MIRMPFKCLEKPVQAFSEGGSYPTTGEPLKRTHELLMRSRYEELGWEFRKEDFDEWYDNSRYAAKAVCEKLRRSTVGEGVYEEL